ncbi:MAG: polysaccharide pyruvyl transferase CsaB [Defluviitaleaceae bacterium]|nr:polysaccharide pyruvyl transferase CsaB [Defluviitaleaceae bacterium]
MNSFEGTKVLMALMCMEIGGAETHVLELCKALKKRGLDVYVVSNGGVYEAELVRHGVKHFKLPLHNKNPKNLVSSYFSLKRIIVENDIRLVHAHARIPAFLCGMLHKKLDFRFVTTTHLNFDTAMHYKILTNWGESTLAVSEDIRDYLVNNYKFPKEKIVVSVNGINTENYHSGIAYADILDEFGLNPANKRIVFMSRLEKHLTPPVHKLLDIAEDIHAKNENAEIIIIGGGSDFQALSDKADAVNRALGKKLITMTGGRTDTAKFLASADIFVGVSRSALEAMACEKPTILSGYQGHLGIFNQNILGAAIETNLTCRGHAEVSAESMRRDVFTLLDASPDKLKELGKFARQVIDNHFSMTKMTDDALLLYDSVRKSSKVIDAVISGYYGSNNHGDDVLLEAITNDLRKINPEIKITAISKRPKETKSIYGVESIQRFNFPRIISSLRRTNLLIMGGGSLIQDLTSTKSLIYYVFVMNLAIRARAKVMLYANGIGPLKLTKNKRRAVAALENVELISLRDEQSERLLKTIGLRNENIVVTADAAFGFNNENPDAGDMLLDKIGLAGKKYFCISIRGWKTLKEDFVSEMAVFCDYMSEKHGLSPLFIPMQTSNDAEISTQVMELARRKSYYLQESFTIDEILSVTSKAEFLVGMRLHSVIYAANTATPVIGLVYDPKVSSMFAELDQKYFMNLEEISSGKLISFSEEIIANRDEISRHLAEVTRPMAEKARRNAKIAHDIINRDLF